MLLKSRGKACTYCLTVSAFLVVHFLPGKRKSSPSLVMYHDLIYRWMMKRYGKYKTMNMVFGILPFFAAILMTQMKETSHPALLWLSIVGVMLCDIIFIYHKSGL